MIPVLVARRKESFERFLPLILEIAEIRYFELRGRYQFPYDCYQELADDHRKLGEYASWLENQQQERKGCSATQRQAPAQADPMS